ncbi:MAG: LysM peptidoglycan-binding domain-containing protein [Candidatus Krumholzibacteria bacterium]|nr:LysM peptidoglycan-binding domain-containing protein [Candidatus Krumholzibacteria bacterium]
MVMKRTTRLIAIGSILALAASCSSYRPRSVDVQKGEYYEDAEYAKLSKKDKEAYCRALATELEGLQGRSKKSEAEVAQNKEKIKSLTKDLREAEKNYAAYTAEIDELSRQLQALSQLPKTWKIRPGDCLWRLASYEEIYQDPLKWPRIWRSNQELIEDPNWVIAGWEVKIPRDYPYAYKVNRDEWLGKIAGYWEIYGDYRKWPVIFEANRDKIKDPDLIFPNEELVIPRQDTLQ